MAAATTHLVGRMRSGFPTVLVDPGWGIGVSACVDSCERIGTNRSTVDPPFVLYYFEVLAKPESGDLASRS